jgi:hypothetical protein
VSDDMQLRPNPAADLHSAYQLVGFGYRKTRAQIERTISVIDYPHLYLGMQGRLPDLDALNAALDRFFRRRQAERLNLNSESLRERAFNISGASNSRRLNLFLLRLRYLHVSLCRMLGSSEHGHYAIGTDRRSVSEKDRSVPCRRRIGVSPHYLHFWLPSALTD